MCGIGGILRFDGKPVERERLEAMQRVLDCRGPDGHAIWIDGPIGLVHTRLAILDKETGQQPMTRGNLTVVFNGEIYNHRDLRKELESLGHNFTSDHSDTEVLLHGYKQWGHDLPKHLEGMFAFAIWDKEKQTLYLARDRCGEKPLYIHRSYEAITFGSTIASVLSGLSSIPPMRIGQNNPLRVYLTYGYTFRQSIIDTVRESGAGAYVILTANNVEARDQQYWNRPTENNQKCEFESYIRSAVIRRLEADVPLGCFLSGGIDSSLVAMLAQDELAKRGARLRSFTISMPDARYDEGPFARRVAQHIGVEHTELRAEPNVEEDLLYLIRSSGEPIGDSSILPTYWLSKATRQYVTVALSGDGGDELFGGYERYVALRLIKKHRWWAKWLPTSLLGGEQKSFRSRLRRFIESSRSRSPVGSWITMIELFNQQQLKSIGFASLDSNPTNTTSHAINSADPAGIGRHWDFIEYLPSDLLRKVDRASMAVGLEVRCPFLDTALVEAALSTPMKVLMPGRETKPILRQIARKYLPADICNRKKMGFAVPIGLWFRGSLKPLLDKWLLDSPALPSLGLNRDYIEVLIREHVSGRLDHTHRLFALLTLAMWRHEFFKPAAG